MSSHKHTTSPPAIADELSRTPPQSAKNLFSCKFILIVSCEFILLLLAAHPSRVNAAQETDHEYTNKLMNQASAAKLADKRYWHLLLHYRPSKSSHGYTSEIDGPDFFLDPNGKNDPQAELNATLKALIANQLVGRSHATVKCVFPARYNWLKSHLSISDGHLPSQSCEQLEEWLSDLNPESVTLIFASSYTNSPPSMFGHTFLRIDKKGQTDTNRLFSTIIDYVADVTTGNGLAVAALGVTGGFKGYFTDSPYYLKVKTYSDMESRDIWEYRLAFNREQIEKMLKHVWELKNTYVNYFFFKQNCSYQILSLLDTADPTLHLTDRFAWWTIPTDTVRAVLDAPGLLTQVSFRPSLSTQLTYHRSLLDSEEDTWLFRILREPLAAHAATFEKIPEERRALIIDIATEYLAYRKVDADWEPLRQQMLLARAMLPVTAEQSPPPPSPTEQGHDTARIGLASGRAAGEWFGQLALRPALHDLLGDETGYTPNTSLEFSNLVLRYDTAHGLAIQRWDLVHIVSLSPLDRLIRKPSWQVSVGLKSVDDLSFRNRSAPSLEVGVGGTAQSGWWRREVWYMLGEAAVQYGEVFDEHHRAGLGATGGLLFDLTPRWRAHGYTRYRAFFLGHRSSDVVTGLEQRYTLSKDWDLRLEWNRRPDHTETVVGINTYF